MSPIITLSLQVMNQSNAPAREGREVVAHPSPDVGLWRWGPEAPDEEHLRD